MLVAALGTVVTYFKETVPTRLAIVDGTGVTVPPERAQRLAALASRLEACGFERAGSAAPRDPDAAGTTYATILADDSTCAWAIDMTRGDIVASYVELLTEWRDGTVVTTVNHSNPSIFDPPQRVREQQLAGAPVAEVVAAHVEACADVPGPRLDPRGLDPLAVAQAQNEELLAYQHDRGILRRRGDDYAFTWSGARRSVKRLLAAQQ